MNKKKINYNKIQVILFIIFSIIIISFSSILAYKVFYFVKSVPVKEVVINGASNDVHAEIINNLSFLKKSKVLSVNLEKLQDYINSLPWIYKSSVSRNLSGKITITVLEINPYFLWQNDEGKYKLIGADDKSVDVRLNFPLSDLITIEQGEEALKKSHKIRFVIYQDLNILKEIKTLKYNGYRWDIILKDGLVIKLPENNVDKAYTKFLLLNKKYKLLEKELEYVDITSTNKLFAIPSKNK